MKQHSLFLISAIFLLLVISFSGISPAQTSELRYYIQSYKLESGEYTGNPGGSIENVFTGEVRVDNAPWLALHFSGSHLGRSSYVIIRSLQDDLWQKLDAVTIEQWQHFSAFFNGNAVEIKLYVAPEDRGVFINLDEVIVGEWGSEDPIESICGPTDDRTPSNHPATGRLLNVGCTSWIIPNGKIVSAGHCLSSAGSVNVLQFQVPPSLPGGTIQHPGPEDQYAADATSRVFVDNGVGADWGVFEVFPNSITGLMPKEAQNAYFTLVQDLGPDSIRITGYGVATGVLNQVQQTHLGPNASSSGVVMRYRTDTMGGNSGSPIIDEATGYSVGVHSHGGCTSSGGNNNGTSFFNSAFWLAVDEGTGGCPTEVASNPTPAHNLNNVSINLAQLSWTNGADAVSTELYFGTNQSTLSLVQSGSLSTSWNITSTLLYGTTYYWRVVSIGDSCDSPGPTWSFRTESDPLLVAAVDTCYPQNANYWTGSTNGTTKTEVSLVKGANTEDGWFIFDNTNINGNGTVIDSIRFHGYVNSTNWPYWSATPLPGLNPLTATASELKSAIQANSASGTAYIFQNEPSTFTTGWKGYTMGTNSHSDFLNSLSQGWFAMGMDSRDNSTTYFINWDGWNETNKPYLVVYYHYLIPVELTSFTATANLNSVTLNWSTATETNNMGFEIEKRVGNRQSAVGNSSGGETSWKKIGFVSGKGTSTDPQSYAFTDEALSPGLYIYRLKQTDFDGTFEYSNEIQVQITVPVNYTLHQNYPNPFNPSTVIEYSLPQQSFVTISIYSILGEVVRTLVNESVDAGYQKVTFDASELPSGMYIYQIKTVNEGRTFVDSKKMMLIK